MIRLPFSDRESREKDSARRDMVSFIKGCVIDLFNDGVTVEPTEVLEYTTVYVGVTVTFPACEVAVMSLTEKGFELSKTYKPRECQGFSLPYKLYPGKRISQDEIIDQIKNRSDYIENVKSIISLYPNRKYVVDVEIIANMKNIYKEGFSIRSYADDVVWKGDL